MMIWPLRSLTSDLRYLLTGVVGLALYGALIRYVRIRTLSWQGGLIVVLYLASMVGLMFLNVVLMFPPAWIQPQ